MHLEEQALEDEVHVMELVDLKKQLLRTEVSASYCWICMHCGFIINDMKYAVALCSFISKHTFFFQNDIQQLRKNMMRLEKQALEEEVHNLQHQSSDHEVCDLDASQEEETSKDEVCDVIWIILASISSLSSPPLAASTRITINITPSTQACNSSRRRIADREQTSAELEDEVGSGGGGDDGDGFILVQGRFEDIEC